MKKEHRTVVTTDPVRFVPAPGMVSDLRYSLDPAREYHWWCGCGAWSHGFTSYRVASAEAKRHRKRRGR